MDSSNIENSTGSHAVRRISIEDARRAAAAINEYMRTWPDPQSASVGARVATLGGFFGRHLSGECRFWIVNRWGWDHLSLGTHLFVERAGQFYIFSGDRLFLETDLYPKSGTQDQSQSQSELTLDDHPSTQEGGAA